MPSVHLQLHLALEQQGVAENQVAGQQSVHQTRPGGGIHLHLTGAAEGSHPGGKVVLIALEAVAAPRAVGVGDADAAGRDAKGQGPVPEGQMVRQVGSAAKAVAGLHQIGGKQPVLQLLFHMVPSVAAAEAEGMGQGKGAVPSAGLVGGDLNVVAWGDLVVVQQERFIGIGVEVRHVIGDLVAHVAEQSRVKAGPGLLDGHERLTLNSRFQGHGVHVPAGFALVHGQPHADAGERIVQPLGKEGPGVAAHRHDDARPATRLDGDHCGVFGG